MLWYKGVHTFPRGISPKVNVVVRLEFELTYFEVAVQPFSHYVIGTPSLNQGFHSPRPVAIPRLKNSVYPTINQKLKGE